MVTLVGIDIGGSKTAVVEGTCEAEIITRTEIPTHACRPFAETFPQLAALVESTIDYSRRAGRSIAAISVSVGGPLQIHEGVLRNPPHLPGWHDVRLKDQLETQFPGIPVRIEHDGNAGALAEFQFGVGREIPGLKHLVFLTLGTGLGAGLIVNGHLLRGASDMAGEIGHMRLAPHGPVGYEKAGSWEGFCSGAGMVHLAKEMFPSRWGNELSIHDLVEAVLSDDEQALQVVQEAGAWLGRGLALLIDSLNPQVIVLGSLGVALGDRLLMRAKRTLAEEALPEAVAACQILPAALGKEIGDIASLMAAISDPQIWPQTAQQAL